MTSTTAARPPSPFSFPQYRAFWAARLAVNIAQNAMVVIIGWQVYDIARRTMAPREAALQLGLIGVAQFVPLLLLTLVAGWTADRADRRWIVRIAFLIEGACAATLGLLAWHGATTLPALFGIAIILGASRAFVGPAMGAIAPNLVPPAVLPAAIAASSIAWQTGAVAGPALGGYLYASHHWLPYAVSTALFAIAVIGLLRIRPLPASTLDRTIRPWRQVVEGLHYVRTNRLVLGTISLDLFAVLLGGATAMLPIYARDILHVGAGGLGNLRAAPALGSAAMAIWFSFRPLQRNVGVKMLVAVAVFGAATVCFGLSTWLPLSLLCLAVLGASDMVSVFIRQSLIQIYTPDAMRGRVGSVSQLFISGSNELGEAESGFLAAVIGPVAAVVGGGIGAVIITLLWARWFPEISAARVFAAPHAPDAAPAQERAT